MISDCYSYGKIALVREQDLPLVMNTSVIRFKPNIDFAFGFLWAFLNSLIFKNQIDLMITGGAQPNFGPYHLNRVLILVPPSKAEQEAIACVLSDTDALITSLNKLIAKKRNIKQAAMQQLLTGKQRLEGFGDSSGKFKQTEIGLIPEGWEVKSLHDICKVNQGLQIAIVERLTSQVEGSKKYITIQSINSGSFSEYIVNYSPSVCCKESDVLMTRTGNTGIVVTGVDGVFHNNFFKINFDKGKIDKEYLVYCLSSNAIRKVILIKAGTSTIPDLNHSDFYSIQIAIPLLEEQQAIAKVLSDMDSEISALEQRRDKTKALKQAMMQELLTGKTRLKS